jgi:hypothetical protein
MVQFLLPETAVETMTIPALDRLKSFASLTVLPLLLLASLFALGRGLDGIIAEGKVADAGRPRHVNASPAVFGTQRALADRAAAMNEGEID